MSFRRIIPGTLALSLLVALPAEAKKPSLKEALRNCAAIASPADRLACFDTLAKTPGTDSHGQPGTATVQTVPAPTTAQRAPSPPVTATEQRTASRARQEQVRQGYDAVVLRAWKNAAGDYFVALTNGEIWKSQARDSGRPVKDGEQVALSPGAVGSWFMEFKTQKRPAIRVALVE